MGRCSCLIHSLVITRPKFTPPPLLPTALIPFRGQSLVSGNGVWVSVYGCVVYADVVVGVVLSCVLFVALVW